ncbi:MAG TPA: ATP-dependent serine peptidase containing a PDZ domain protein, partial [Microbacterium sp.]|nr:ATP-dependent serine peptidase containing a PDZ domain protein [Microbacterium sp.]
VDEIPGDLQVFSVATLDDALSVLDAISSDGDLSQLPTCQ